MRDDFFRCSRVVFFCIGGTAGAPLPLAFMYPRASALDRSLGNASIAHSTLTTNPFTVGQGYGQSSGQPRAGSAEPRAPAINARRLIAAQGSHGKDPAGVADGRERTMALEQRAPVDRAGAGDHRGVPEFIAANAAGPWVRRQRCSGGMAHDARSAAR